MSGGTHLSQAVPGSSKPLQPGRREQELSLPRDHHKPSTARPPALGEPGLEPGAGTTPAPTRGGAGRAGSGAPRNRASLGAETQLSAQFYSQRLLPARPPPHGGKDGEKEGGKVGGRRCPPRPPPRAVGGRAEGPDALPATNPAPFVFLNHAAARALRPIRSAAAPAGQWRGPPRFFKPSLSPNRRPARSAQPRPPLSSPQPVPTGTSANDPLALDLARELLGL